MTEAVILLGHGEPAEPRSYRPVLDQRDTLREISDFDRVEAAFLNGEPAVSTVVPAIDADRLIAVPVFVSQGYFVSVVVPETIRNHVRTGVDLTITGPIGTDGRVTDIIRERYEASSDDGQDGLALIGHGARNRSANRKTVMGHAERLREAGVGTAVESFFLEERPRPGAVPDSFKAEAVVVVPVFVAEGPHVLEDVPDALGLDSATGTVRGTRLRYTEPIGPDSRIADIARDRASATLETNRPAAGVPGGGDQ